MNKIAKSTIGVLALAILGAITLGWGVAGRSVVTMTGQDTFAPKNVRVRAGSTVTWQNRDKDNHTVASDTGVAGLDSDAKYPNGLAPRQRFSWTVPANAASGTKYYYHCRIHGKAGNGRSFGSGMVGVITVK